MKKILICLLTILSINQVAAQFNLNTESAKVSSINSSIEKVYFKKGRDRIFLKSDSIIFERDYYNFNTRQTYIFEKKIKNESFNVSLNQLQNLDKGQQVIDKAPIYIETYFTDNTKGKQMIYSNIMIEDLFGKLSTKYRTDMDFYLNQLPSGKYSNQFFINRRIKDNQSNFYKVIEKELVDNGIINDDIYNQPLIYINKVQSTFDELNRLDMNKIEAYQILDDTSIYGSSAKNGIIKIILAN